MSGGGAAGARSERSHHFDIPARETTTALNDMVFAEPTCSTLLKSCPISIPDVVRAGHEQEVLAYHVFTLRREEEVSKHRSRSSGGGRRLVTISQESV